MTIMIFVLSFLLGMSFMLNIINFVKVRIKKNNLHDRLVEDIMRNTLRTDRKEGGSKAFAKKRLKEMLQQDDEECKVIKLPRPNKKMSVAFKINQLRELGYVYVLDVIKAIKINKNKGDGKIEYKRN